MARIKWHEVGKKIYETGVKQTVLYVKDNVGLYPEGIPWNGVTNITESPSGAEPTALYADDIKYLSLMSVEEFSCTVEAYTYPDEFLECDGSSELVLGVAIGQQPRKGFGLCYKTTLGNDVDGNEFGYKLHIIYNGLASPSDKGYDTVNDSPEAITFSWEVNTTPVNATGFKPTSSITIDSTKASKVKLLALEDILYGKDGAPTNKPRLPLPDEIATLMGPVIEG